jgi:hypothetical protein
MQDKYFMSGRMAYLINELDRGKPSSLRLPNGFRVSAPALPQKIDIDGHILRRTHGNSAESEPKS